PPLAKPVEPPPPPVRTPPRPAPPPRRERTPPMPRLLATLLLLPALIPSRAAAQAIDPSSGKADPGGALLWYDVRQLGVEAQGWADTKDPFDRLPAKAEKSVRAPVWSLGRHSAGLCVRFVTDAPAVHARWSLTSNRLAMPHMPAT